MEIKNIKEFEKASKKLQKDTLKIAFALLFLIVAALLALIFGQTNSRSLLLMFAAVIGGYMAMNIGANDVCNNVGPAVGSKAISMGGAILIAGVCEMLGAVIAGGEVVSTIKGRIVLPELIADAHIFIKVMLASLLSGALWLHVATLIGAPVSTSHSVVGGVIGAGIAAAGASVVNWSFLLGIVASWVVSPLMGALIAMFFLMFIKKTIAYKEDKKSAALKVVPYLVALMILSFSWYLVLKVFKRLYAVGFEIQLVCGCILALLIFILFKRFALKKALKLENSHESINELFNIPLIFAAALLSFAHGANDVANAIGPLAAISQTLGEASGSVKNALSSVPLWIMIIGGAGIALGLSLYGPKLIKTVGSEITELDKMQAFCIALSAVITVLLASQLGLPVSSTHIVVGAVFGVGFLRERLREQSRRRFAKIRDDIVAAHFGGDLEEIEGFLERFDKASLKEKSLMLESLKKSKNTAIALELKKKEKKSLKKVYKEEVIKRSILKKIVTAWLVTVPISALLGVLLFIVLNFAEKFF
ncbi:inorganic phosphate transporter [Helicobacter acinonychis]|uniref:Phosphate transporter n=1 Tax=Helicobacter acinonychis (strain Sheeba) TaxID=382638 RepID=Q17V79_HELAH|nr:inorganic phosphate transporter [Helicobacter acinonychis]CAK00447.1 phosphate permease [Helicobacter acinonychis str. Sheeba]STP05038.1 phosphate permease [Helicobacter acinonychis]